MNDITRSIIGYAILIIPILIIAAIIYFKIKQIINEKKMTPEERKINEERKLAESKKTFYELLSLLIIIIIIIFIVKLMITGQLINTI